MTKEEELVKGEARVRSSGEIDSLTSQICGLARACESPGRTGKPGRQGEAGKRARLGDLDRRLTKEATSSEFIGLMRIPGRPTTQ